MPKTVLHVLGTAQFEGSSIAGIVRELAAGLDPSVYRVHACFLGGPGPLINELRSAGAIAQHIYWTRGARDPLGAWRFWRYLREHDFAIVHQHFGARSVRRLIKTASQARLIVHLHGHLDETASFRSLPIAVGNADVVVAPSKSVALQVAQLHPIVVYAGVPTASRRTGRKQLAANAVVIGTACRLVPLKGLMDLLVAIAALSAEFPNLRLEIAGRGPIKGVLKREVDRLGLTEQVCFLGWRRDLRAVLQSWDVFALPSLDEGLPLAVLHAMAEGLPVVATSVGGLPELIEDGRTGFLVRPGDPAALAQALRCLIVDPERRLVQGNAGRERARNFFSVDRMVAQIAAIYDALQRQANPTFN